MKNKQILFAIVVLFSVWLLRAQADDAEQNQNEAQPGWSDYKQLFDKKYSTLSQELERQRIFLSNLLQTFMTQIKYRLKQLSYYTSINKYSDLTAEESAKMLNGAVNDLNEDDLIDDELAEKILMESAREDEERIDRDDEMVSKRRRGGQAERRKRSVELEPPKPKLRWFVDQKNPDYKPISGRDKARAAATSVRLIKGAIGGAIKWFSPGKWRKPAEIEQPVETIVEKDWRQSGCIGPAEDQDSCLSCYAITITDYIQWAFCMNENRLLTPLSVQYVISCGKQLNEETEGKIRLQGCSGGVIVDTVEFINEYGSELGANMPYLAHDTDCPVAKQTAREQKGYIRPNVDSFLRLSSQTTKLDLALKEGPVVVSMRAPKDFVAYGGGIIEQCLPSGGHAMLVVGSMSDDGVEYLLIKNSFGPSWGYNGYFKLKRSATKDCVIQFIVPRMSFPGKRSYINSGA